MDFSSSGLVASVSRTLGLVVRSFDAEFARPSPFFKRSGKRAAVLGLLAVALPLHVCWHHLGFLLDEVFFSGYKEAAIPKPVFVISNARSGSTFLQRLLFGFKEVRFSSISVWEMLFAQSVTHRMMFSWLGKIDSMVLGGACFRMFQKLDSRLSRWSRANLPHPFSLLQPDEDEWMMSSFGMSQLMGLLFPLLDSRTPITRLVDFDTQLSAKEQEEYWNSFASLVKRHLYFEERFRGKKDLTYLSKNPTFTLRLSSLLERFPDARVVVVVRDPEEAIPSMVSYICAWWWLVASPRTAYPFRDELQGMCTKHYTYPLEIRKRAPSTCKFLLVKYEELKTELTPTMRWVLQSLDASGADTFNAADAQELLDGEPYHHRHSLTDTLGMTQSDFRTRHQGIYAVYPEYS